jgi:cyclopropane-fatty-acyl-phospholipid synthase
MFDLERQQLQAMRSLIRMLAAELDANASVKLWNGEVLPLGTSVTSDIELRIASPDVVRSLVRDPSIATLFGLYGSGQIDILGASPYEASASYDHMNAVKVFRKLNKLKLAQVMWPFLLKAGTGAADQTAFGGTQGKVFGKDRDDQAMIRFHYDVSNDFYALFLDREMVYSSAYFRDRDATLDEAQQLKLDRICRKLDLKPGETLLDIGCGWGSLLCHAVRHYGVKAHGVTLSREQHAYCTTKIAALGLEGRATVEIADYREIRSPDGGFSKIAQIEMFEHLGFENHDLHFETVRRLLAPRGLYLHQASVRRATKDISRFRWMTVYMDFITRYIFPGGELDYIGLTATNLERHNFEIHDIEAMREHFALTTAEWARRLWNRRDEAEALAGRERARIWLLYFTLFARGFERGAVQVFQTLASKRRAGPSALPLARADLYRPR